MLMSGGEAGQGNNGEGGRPAMSKDIGLHTADENYGGPKSSVQK